MGGGRADFYPSAGDVAVATRDESAASESRALTGASLSV